MAWSKRGENKYFYRSRREGSRVRSVYLGKGELANLAAQADALARAQRQQRAEELRELKWQLKTVGRGVDELCRMAELVARSELLIRGFYLHARSEWRKRRGRPEHPRGERPTQPRRVQAAG